jgi:hypothetical protein
MTEQTFHAFTQLFLKNTSTPRYSSGELGVAVPPALFIEPNVREVEHEDSAPVVLIAAPAAVGKSFLAQQLSSVLNAVYWDLGSFSLGSNFFIGTAVKAYGADGYSSFVAEVRNGRRVLVLDAADEALVRAGRENYGAAFENLAEMIGNAERPSVIILGRDDTIEDTRSILTEQGVRVSRYSVAYFDQKQASSFVRLKASRKGQPVIKEFDPFMRRFEGAVQTALGVQDWESARGFLGYAPVLDALAAFYADEKNPIRVLQSASREVGDSYTWRLLAKILDDVLEREQDKFKRSFGGDDIVKQEFAGAAFTKEAQISYLLDASSSPPTYAFAEDGEDHWYAEVEEKIAEQIRVHPFLTPGTERNVNPLLAFASPVFRDYAIAVALTRTDLLHEALLAAYWRSSSVNPTPILAGLLLSGSISASNPLPPEALGIIHDSHASSEGGANSSILMTITPVALEGNQDHVLLYRVTASHEGPTTSLTVSLGERPPAFNRSVARALVDLWGLEARLGDGFADFLIGPNVIFVSESIQSSVAEIRVRGLGKEPGVLLSADSLGGATRRIDSQPQAALRVISRGQPLGYPWHKHVIDVDTAGSAGIITLDDAMEVRRLVMWFTKPSMFGGGLRYPIAAADALVAKRRISSEVFEFLISEGYVSRKGDEYLIDLPVQTKVILQNELSDESYSAFLKAYSTWKVANGSDTR